MLASTLIVNGLVKVFQVVKYSDRARKVCRIYDFADNRIPEKLLEETIPGSNIFRDRINNLRFKHTTEGMISI